MTGVRQAQEAVFIDDKVVAELGGVVAVGTVHLFAAQWRAAYSQSVRGCMPIPAPTLPRGVPLFVKLPRQQLF